ncbi:hypothetical protein LPJ61_004359 [Coemansia biformis]|uniref:H/ACA ribonucleoprotein complex subunit n=1 Tax=Coemansia biformis TaxID=1286918 RepID=A0A9W8CXB9_9FUNG|nr:hypothetical protein LPJ61_004359 [Coemansia biformis]
MANDAQPAAGDQHDGGARAAGSVEEEEEVLDQGVAQLLQMAKDTDGETEAEPAVEPAVAPAAADGESSDTDSSSSSGSDFDIDSDDEGGEGKSVIQLIAEGGGDDDEDGIGPGSVTLVTRHEITNPTVPEPPIAQVPDSAQLCALGAIHSIVGSSVIIQAHISGETHVLDSESLVAFADGKVLGMVFDVFGPVARPMYTVRFNSVDDIDGERCTAGSPVFYAMGWSRMLSTERLRIRGTDASNEYDEEIGSDAMEFSDDEAEIAFKRKRKRERTQRINAPSSGPAVPPPPPSAVDQPASVAGRKLQSYEDICDPDLGF